MTTTNSRSQRAVANSDRWTPAELAEVRSRLSSDLERLQFQVSTAANDFGAQAGDLHDVGDEVVDISSLMVDISEGSSLADNDNDILHQTERALERIDALMYGTCESCAGPIPKARMLALPRATHCVACQSARSRR